MCHNAKKREVKPRVSPGLSSVIFAAIFLCPLLLSAEEGPDVNELYFHDDIFYGGSGCPNYSVSTGISEDGMALSVFFDEYSVYVGPETSPNDAKACSLSIPLHIPPGWQYSVVEMTYRGMLYLDKKVRAKQRSEYYFQGYSGPRMSSTWWGPKDEDYFFVDTLGVSSWNLEWSPCDVQRNLNLRTYLSVNNSRNRKGYGEASTDSIDGQIKHIYKLLWRRCSN